MTPRTALKGLCALHLLAAAALPLPALAERADREKPVNLGARGRGDRFGVVHVGDAGHGALLRQVAAVLLAAALSAKR